MLLAAYKDKIDELKARGGYVTADVIDVFPDTPNLDAMLNKFNSEHWHDEDEVRFIVEGRGLFTSIRRAARSSPIEVEAGDLIRVPRGTHHWFDLCADRRIRAIRLFQDPSGWTPHYTQSGVDKGFQPVCFGPAYFRRRRDRACDVAPRRTAARRPSCSTSRARRRRSRSSTTCCFRTRARISRRCSRRHARSRGRSPS